MRAFQDLALKLPPKRFLLSFDHDWTIYA